MIIRKTIIDYNENEKEYKGLMLRIGGTMLIFLALFTLYQVIYLALSPFLLTFLGETKGTIVGEILNAGLYFASFMLPVLFFRLISKGKRVEPMRLFPRLPLNAPLLIFASLGIVFACSSINGMLLQPLVDADLLEELFADPTDYTKDYVVVLQFISVAIVPGICEEFLFRGMILSSLAPYGKTGAVIVSALLFGFMHQNPFQMFYATAAGIVLGLMYLYTNSIWCCMITHILNNTLSLVMSVTAARLPVETANTVDYAILSAVFVLSAISILVLTIFRKTSLFPRPALENGVFGVIPPEAEGYAEFPVAPEKKIRLFFSPTMIIFLGLILFSFVSILSMVSGGGAA